MNHFERLFEEIAREQDALLDKHNAQAEVRSRLAELDAASLRRKAPLTPGKRMLWAGASGVALAAAAVLLVLLKTPAPQPIAVRLADEQTDLQVGQFVQAPQEREMALRFSDGSEIQVTRRSRARLMGLRHTGADVSLESGSMHVAVQHRDDTSWHIGAGPFGVHVIGTRFDVRWKPEDDSFELSLHEGQVEISGCVFGGGYRMLAGQTVRASCKDDRYDTRAIGTGQSGAAAGSGSVESFLQKPAEAASAQPAPTAQPAVPLAAEAAQPAAPARSELAAAVTRPQPRGANRNTGSVRGGRTQHAAADWQNLARAGQYAQALRAVRALGFERECEHGSAEELSLLAKLARYGQDTEAEGLALRLLRERFRGTQRAAAAAFALGRLEFDNHGAYAEAAEWFRTYLKEQPRGELSREAEGRLLEAVERTGDHATAQDLAQRYLQDYPQGPHAALAKSLLSRP